MNPTILVSLLGTVVLLLTQGAVAVFIYGKLTERVASHTEELSSQRAELSSQRTVLTEQGQRISTVEGRLDTALPCGINMPLSKGMVR